MESAINIKLKYLKKMVQAVFHLMKILSINHRFRSVFLKSKVIYLRKVRFDKKKKIYKKKEHDWIFTDFIVICCLFI